MKEQENIDVSLRKKTKSVCLAVCPEILKKLKQANNTKKQKNKNFSWYKAEIANIFGMVECDIQRYNSVKYKTFYGGFVCGEGSINVTAKKSKNALFGLLIDPEFSVTQHVNGFEFLFAALNLFGTGSIHYKSGSNGTLVYRIDNRRALSEKVIPFWETYILPYQFFEAKQGKQKKQEKQGKQRLNLFKRILLFLEEKKHKDVHFFVDQILPLWDKLRKQKGQLNQLDLETAKSFVIKKKYQEKRKGSSETKRDLI